MKRIEKEIRKLLARETLTGDDAGRIMILDFLEAYNDLTEGGEGRGVLSDDEKINIVSRLTLSCDIQRFNDFRGVHDFLSIAPVVYNSYKKTFEVYYWRIISLVTSMGHSEKERLLHIPVIMTQQDYARFLESKEPAPVGGIAVLQDIPDTLPYNAEESIPLWRKSYSAESILNERSLFIKEALNIMKDMLAECMARKKAIELIARYIKLPQIKILIPEIDKEKITILNEIMSETIKSVKRIPEGKKYESELNEKLSALFDPIRLDELSPLPEDITKARRALNYSVIKNGSEAFIASLKRKWRE